jgi:hypothetical protein
VLSHPQDEVDVVEEIEDHQTYPRLGYSKHFESALYPPLNKADNSRKKLEKIHYASSSFKQLLVL